MCRHVSCFPIIRKEREGGGGGGGKKGEERRERGRGKGRGREGERENTHITFYSLFSVRFQPIGIFSEYSGLLFLP